jgi:hypothetical protein
MSVIEGISQQLTRPVPSSVTKEEFQVYSAWLSSYVAARKMPTDIFILSSTFPVKCSIPDSQMKRCRESARLLNPLLALGDAEYRLDRTSSIVVPFPYRFVDTRPASATNPYDTFSFTRVALNRSNSEGFFAVGIGRCEGVTPKGLVCGDGISYFVHAYRTEPAGWRFVHAKECPMCIE